MNKVMLVPLLLVIQEDLKEYLEIQYEVIYNGFIYSRRKGRLDKVTLGCS